MWSWIMTTILSFLYSAEVAAATKAVVTDLTTHGLDLTTKAVALVKEANDNNIENKWEYVYGKMVVEFTSAGKSAIGTAIEAAQSAIKQGLIK